MRTSETIGGFLAFIRECETQYGISRAEYDEAQRETQDLLHKLELDECKYHEMARISRLMKSVRMRRREAKDSMNTLRPVVEWADKNKPAIAGMERLLGAVRKEERRTENRSYVPRTDILDREN